MYRKKELLGKEVIGSDGSIIGEVIGIKFMDDMPYMVVGEKHFMVGRKRALSSRTVVKVPYDSILTVHDKVMISLSRDEIMREKEELEE
ncbi:MAG: hypothetical protein ACE5NL_02265 [Candidatus Hydrothermarchaeaceae archaeon]